MLAGAAQPGVRIAALPAVRDGEAQQLLGDAKAELMPHTIAQREIDGDKPQRGQPAQGVHALKEQHAATRPGCGKGGGNARDAAAGDDDVIAVIADGELLLRLDDGSGGGHVALLLLQISVCFL